MTLSMKDMSVFYGYACGYLDIEEGAFVLMEEEVVRGIESLS